MITHQSLIRRLSALAASLGLVACAGFTAGAGSERVHEVVKTQYGPIKGMVLDGVRAYLGIPYAASTAGELRWKPPVAPAAWKEIDERCLCSFRIWAFGLKHSNRAAAAGWLGGPSAR